MLISDSLSGRSSGANGYLPYGSGLTAIYSIDRAFTFDVLPADESASTYVVGGAAAVFARGTLT